MTEEPSRGEIWMADLNPTLGREQAGARPVLIVSVNSFNHGPAELVVVAPLTSKHKKVPLHVRIEAPEGGLSVTSFVKCEDIRSISKERLFQKRGIVSSEIFINVEDRIRMLLGL
jgi:mRNA interferase MazF